MTKNANFSPNLVVFGQQILIFTGGCKSFWFPHSRKKHHGTLFALFWLGMGRIGQKNANIWPKMTKNAYFGPILAIFGPKILIFRGVSKRFGTNWTENHLDNLSALFFGQALDQMGQIWPFLGPRSNFLGAGSKNFGTLVSGFQWDTFFVLKTLISEAPIGR